MSTTRSLALAVALTAITLLSAAGCCSTPLQTPSPAAPTWGKAVLRVSARGVQKYVCQPDHSWKFTGPQAELFADDGSNVGTHSMSESGPVWEIGGGRVVGTKLRERTSPNAGAIPELQLAGKASGDGVLATVTFIERLNTTGGAMPAMDPSIAIGTETQVPYTADYVFYAAKP